MMKKKMQRKYIVIGLREINRSVEHLINVGQIPSKSFQY